MSNPFFQALNSTTPTPDPRQPAIDVLEQFCDAIRLYKRGKLECRRTLGFTTNLGQEHRVLLIVPLTKYEYVLLRVYIPPTARDITVDTYDASLTKCPDVQSLKATLESFITLPETRHLIESLAR